MDIAQLSTQLKTKTPAMVYLILGKQQVLQQQAIDAFISLIPENEQVMNVGLFSISAFVNKSLIKFVFKGLNLNCLFFYFQR